MSKPITAPWLTFASASPVSRLRFVTDPGDGSGAGAPEGGQPKPNAKGPEGEDLGFPEETALEQMTVEQREAYWRDKAKKHEKRANSRADYDDLKAQADELAKLKAANATQAEKDLEEARRQGENIGAARYLSEAVKGRFQALTSKTDDEIDTIFEHANAQSFVNDKGDIDTEKLKSYAAAFGTRETKQEAPHDPVAAAMAAQRQTPGNGHTGSVTEMQRQRVEQLKSKGK